MIKYKFMMVESCYSLGECKCWCLQKLDGSSLVYSLGECKCWTMHAPSFIFLPLLAFAFAFAVASEATGTATKALGAPSATAATLSLSASTSRETTCLTAPRRYNMISPRYLATRSKRKNCSKFYPLQDGEVFTKRNNQTKIQANTISANADLKFRFKSPGISAKLA